MIDQTGTCDRSKVVLQPSGLKAEVISWHETHANVKCHRGAELSVLLSHLDFYTEAATQNQTTVIPSHADGVLTAEV